MNSQPESDDEPALPNPLPPPLSDPLRIYRGLMSWLVLPGVWLSVLVPCLLPQFSDRSAAFIALAAAVASNAALLMCVYCLLPTRPTNAIYLRSFRNDARTGGLRVAAQRALGDGFRLSGIRDPRRRWHWLVRHVLYVLFLVRYAQPKYMNLEAGDDWKARLWRSLGEARCALIDVSELTSFVQEEIELAVRCLGLHRVLFVADGARTEDERRAEVAAALGASDLPPERVRVARWVDTPSGRAAFAARVRAFAAALPDDEPELNPLAFPAPSTTDPRGNALRGESRLAFLLATFLSLAATFALGRIETAVRPSLLVSYFPVVAFDALVAILLIQYAFACGSWRTRVRLGTVFSFTAVVAGLPVAFALFTPPSGSGPVHGAERMRGQNNLKQIGLALHNYEDSHNRPVPWAVCRPDGTPLLSWRVLLLPHLECDELYKQFRLNEPWDSPHNVQLLGQTPRVYQSPYRPSRGQRPQGGAADTPYQMVVGPGTVRGELPPAGRRPRPFWLDSVVFDPPFRVEELGARGHRIVVAEAADPVPWTKPADIEFRPATVRTASDELTRQLGASRWGLNVLMSDGSVRSFPAKLGSEELDPLIIVTP